MDHLVMLCAGAAAGVLGFGWGFAVWRRTRLIADTPTARIRSMPMGRVELNGLAQEKAELLAPITKTPCVYYRYTVEEERKSGKNKTWVTVDRGDSSSWGFYLEDPTGSVLVMPAGAEVTIGCDFEARHGGFGSLFRERDQSFDPSPWVDKGWFGWAKKFRFRESRIHTGERLYVLGVSQERRDLGTERRQRVLDKLRALKSDPDAMAHLDTDGDGQVSDDEWEVARNLVTQEVYRGAVDDRVIVGADPQRDAPFLISDRGEEAVLAVHRWKFRLGIFGGAALSVACVGLLVWNCGGVGG